MRRATVIVFVSSFCLLGADGQDDLSGIYQKTKDWKSEVAVEVFGPKTLWNAINGGAEVYLAYGFERLHMGELSQGDLRVSMNIFDMGAGLNAFGIYRKEKPRKGVTLAIGAQASSAPPFRCTFYKDRFYVKIGAMGGELSTEKCRELASATAALLPGDNQAPGVFALLPKKDRIAGSVGYTLESWLGLSELAHCLHAEYNLGQDQAVSVFVMLPASSRPVEKTWQKLASKWTPIKSDKGAFLSRSVPYRGDVVLAKTKRGIFGVAGAGKIEQSMALLLGMIASK